MDVPFPPDLASVLTGASLSQLAAWRRPPPVLVPEVSSAGRIEYSFRDLVALRSFVRLRSQVSLQKIRKALTSLRGFDLTDHPSQYQLVTDGDSVFLVQEENAIDLVRKPGQQTLLSLADIFRPFENRQGREVVDFQRPRERLQVREQRLGGWPTIQNTRVGYDSVAKLIEGGVSASDVSHFYSTVDAPSAEDAYSLFGEVRGLRSATG